MKTKTGLALLVVVLAMMAGDRHLAAMSYTAAGGGGGTAGNSGIGGTTTNSPGSDGIINVLNYGATGTGFPTDDTAAVQTALDAAVAAPHPVYFPPSPAYYWHTAPWRITGNGMNIYGAGQSTVFKQNYLGAAFLVDGLAGVSGNALTYGAALVGTGNSLNTTGTKYIALNEMLYSQAVRGLDGRAAFDVEFFFRTPAAFPGNETAIYMLRSYISNPGVVLSPTGTGVFKVYTTNSTGILHAYFNLTGGIVTLNSAAPLSTSTTYDIAMDYDGSTCRLFIDGSVSASAACSGTVVQNPFEIVTVPEGETIYWPNDGWQAGHALPGFIDAIHISKISRHTTGYTPAVVKPTADANSLLIENFETPTVDGMQVAHTGSVINVSLGYLPIYGGGLGGVGVHLHDMKITDCCGAPGDGVTVMGWGGEYDHLFNEWAGYYGMSFPAGGVGTFYENVHDNDVAAANCGGCLVNAEATGYFYGHNFTEGRIVNNRISTIGLTGSVNIGNAIDDNSNFIGEEPMRFGWIVEGMSTFKMPFDDLEASDPEMIAGMFIREPYAAVHIDDAQLITQGGTPALMVYGGTSPIVNNLFYTTAGGTGFGNYVIDFLLAPTTQAVLNGSAGITIIPVSNLPQWITSQDCGASVTLSTGSGTFTSNCLTSASVCHATDVTTFSNVVTLGASTDNTAGTPGTVAITGTGSDVVKVVCQ